VVDRLIQQALLQVLSPLYEPTFSEHSYGFRPGRKAHDAVEAARRYVSEGRAYVVDLDLEKFFDRVNHDILMSRLARRIGDKRVLGLIRRYLSAGVMQNGVVIERYEGTPQGGPLSPLLANVLLDEMDQELSRRGHAFCRYADDCNIYVRSRRAGERVLASVTGFLAKRLRLKVNREKSGVGHPWERKFLGFRILWGGVQLGIAPQALDRAKGKIREITRRTRGVSLDRVLRELRTYTDGWVGYFHVIRSPEPFRALDGWIRRRVRSYRWTQWKTSHRRARELIRRGVTRKRAFARAWGRSGVWRTARSRELQVALPNAHLAELGFHSLYERYTALAAS
jgi:RNA-directed DNA polymerase